MPLSKTFGQIVSGSYCAADTAFERFERETKRIHQDSSWAWFFERVEALEAQLTAAGGFDKRMYDAIENGSFVLWKKEDVDRYFVTTNIVYDIEDSAAAFFVTVQTRLNAIGVAAHKIYVAAREEDQLTVAERHRHFFTNHVNEIWQLANYVKHNDEWDATLDTRQQRCFEVLKRLGTASDDPVNRFVVPWVVVDATHRITMRDTPSAALRNILAMCRDACKATADIIRQDFEPFASQIESLRKRNMEKNGASGSA